MTKRGIFGALILILIIGIGAAVIATRQSTEYRQRASEVDNWGTWIGYFIEPPAIAYGPQDSSLVSGSFVFDPSERPVSQGIVYHIATHTSPDGMELRLNHTSQGPESISVTDWSCDLPAADAQSACPPGHPQEYTFYEKQISEIGNYVSTYYDSVSGKNLQTIAFKMSSSWVSNNIYSNEVYFKNQNTGNFDLVHKRSFLNRSQNLEGAHGPSARLEFFTRQLVPAFHNTGFKDLQAEIRINNQTINTPFSQPYFTFQNPFNFPYQIRTVQGSSGGSWLATINSSAETAPPTSTPTPSPSPTPTTSAQPFLPVATEPPPTITTAPTAAPTGAPATGTRIALTVGLDGIGNTGDEVNRTDTSSGNKNPLEQYRNKSITVEVYSLNETLVSTFSNITPGIFYNTSNNLYTGTIDLSDIWPGDYVIKLKVAGYLKRKIPGIRLAQGKTYTVNHSVSGGPNLIAGDLDNDNLLTVSDWNIMNACIFNKNPAVCSQTHKARADYTADGVVDDLDYGLFLRENTTPQGD